MSRRARPTPSLRALIVVVGGVALLLRLVLYVENPAVSTDEAQLALNLDARSVDRLFRALDFNQGAPPFFLVVVREIIAVAGKGEHALRAFPLAASLVSVPLFVVLVRRLLPPQAQLVAVTCWAASAPLIVYATTVKPYASDGLTAVGLYLLGMVALERGRLRDLFVLAAVGAVAVWMSYPAVFFLAGIGLAVLPALTPRLRSAAALAAIVAVPVAAFAVLYVAVGPALRHLEHTLNAGSLFGTAGNFSNFTRSAAGDVRYLAGVGHLSVGGVDLGHSVAVAAIVLIVVGFVGMLRTRTSECLAVALPLVVGAFAVLIGRYPIYPRTLLFMIPGLIIFLAAGIWMAVDIFSGAKRIAALAVAAVVVGFVTVPGVTAVLIPSEREAMRGVMGRIAPQWRDGEVLYLYYAAQYSFRYYLECRCFASGRVAARAASFWRTAPTNGADQWAPALQSRSRSIVIGRRLGAAPVAQLADLSHLPLGRPVWIVLADMSSSDRSRFRRCLDAAGRLESTVVDGTRSQDAARAFRYVLARRPACRAG